MNKKSRMVTIVFVIFFFILALYFITQEIFIYFIARKYIKEHYSFPCRVDVPQYSIVSDSYLVLVHSNDARGLSLFTLEISKNGVYSDDYIQKYFTRVISDLIKESLVNIWGTNLENNVTLSSPNLVQVPLMYSTESSIDDILSDENRFTERILTVTVPGITHEQDVQKNIWETICKLKEMGSHYESFMLFINVYVEDEQLVRYCFTDITSVENSTTVFEHARIFKAEDMGDAGTVGDR